MCRWRCQAEPDELLDDPVAICALGPRRPHANHLRFGTEVGLELIAVLNAQRLEQGERTREVFRSRILVDEHDILRRLLRAPDDFRALTTSCQGAGNQRHAG